MSKFSKLDVANIRRSYNMNVSRMRISLQPDIMDAMEQIGVIERTEAASGRIVAKRGGQGSAFLQMAALITLGLLNTDISNGFLEEGTERLKNMLTPDGMLNLETNLDKMIEILRRP